MNQDTKDHLKRNIAKLDGMIKALDTEIRFNQEASQNLCAAYNHLRIAKDNMQMVLIGAKFNEALHNCKVAVGNEIKEYIDGNSTN